MPAIMLGREGFALPIGETRVGGVGNDALPFPALRQLPTVAILHVSTSDEVTLWPHGNSDGAVSVNGTPLGTEPLAIAHGAKLEIGGVRLIFRDGREIGSTGPITRVAPAQVVPPAAGEPGTPIPEGGRLLRLGAESTITIWESGLVIGRDADCDLVISGMEVSRRHAVVRRSERGYVLTDVSRNGTYVNQERIDGNRLLAAGDVIRIGDEEFRFESGTATRDPAATAPASRSQTVPEPATAVRSRLSKTGPHR